MPASTGGSQRSPSSRRPAPAKVDLLELAQWAAGESRLFAGDGSPFTAQVAPGAPRLVVITGENASGKSLLFKVLMAKVRVAGARPVTLSIRERSGSGSFDMARIRQVMMFGDEGEQSTGAGSVRVLRSAFERNLDADEGRVLGLDEPELGLSEGYARALGQYIGTQTKTVPRGCSGVVVVTHSRTLVEGLVEGYGRRPTFVATGSGSPATLPAKTSSRTGPGTRPCAGTRAQERPDLPRAASWPWCRRRSKPDGQALGPEWAGRVSVRRTARCGRVSPTLRA